MFFKRRPRTDPPRIAEGERIYAIGDIHGEARLFKSLLDQILRDNELKGAASTTLILLGDIIDRGMSSAGLLETVTQVRSDQFIVLKGNHEAWLVECYRGDEEAARFWLQYGGAQTMLSLGISESELNSFDNAGLVKWLQSNIDPDLIEWIERLPTSWSSGDYFFTHAGIRPGVLLDLQVEDDLLWIRKPFLTSKMNHGKIVVHGHTIEPGVPILGGNRIGIDTGAHEHRCLTALGLQNDRQWILQATDAVNLRIPESSRHDQARRGPQRLYSSLPLCASSKSGS